MRVKRTEMHDYYKNVLRLAIDGKQRLSCAAMRKQIRPYLMAGQSDVHHLNTLLKRCMADGLIERVEKGVYRLTELGAA